MTHPAAPPPGAHPLLWRLAHRLYQDHSSHIDGFCVACREYWPCDARRLAERGLDESRAPRGPRNRGPHT